MTCTNDKIKKICNFYVGEWHLITMLIPYLNQIEKTTIITCMEKDFNPYVDSLLNKIKLEEKSKEKIRKIDWTSKKTIASCLEKNKEYFVIVSGSNLFIDKINAEIEEKMESLNKITVINCFKFAEYHNIQDILKNHDKILNTSGEKEISEVFKTYQKKAI